MKNIRISKNLFFILVTCICTFFVYNQPAQADISNTENSLTLNSKEHALGLSNLRTKTTQTQRYVPNSVLIGLKEGESIENILSNTGIKLETAQRLNAITPVVTDLKKNYKLEKDSNGWYWFFGKQYKEIGSIPEEVLFKEAYKSMTEEEKSVYRIFEIKLPEGSSVEETVAILKNNPGVEYAQPNYIYNLNLTPNDPRYNELYGMQLIHSEGAWDYTQGLYSSGVNVGKPVVVADIDTGADYTHEDLAANIWINSGEDLNKNNLVDPSDFNGKDDDVNGYVDDIRGWNFYDNNNNPLDDIFHGTHTAGTIAAIGNNGLGVIGVAPKAKVMILRALGSGGGSVSNLAKAIKYAADNGAKVLSNSWGGSGEVIDSVLRANFVYAYTKNCTIVTSAGNSGAEAMHQYPTNLKEVISVSATDQTNQLASFSNNGQKIDIAAPGVEILSTVPTFESSTGSTYNYLSMSGTSMSCPHISGIAALILSRHPEFTPEEVRQVLRFSAQKSTTWDEKFGYGIALAREAVSIDSVCIAKITAPLTNTKIDSTILNIYGRATGINSLRYILSYGKGETPSTWTKIMESFTRVETNGLLGSFDTSNLSTGVYVIKLEVMDTSNRVFNDRIFLKKGLTEFGWGFPVEGAWAWYSSPAVADVNNDGKKEIVLSNKNGICYAWKADADYLNSNWPKSYYGGSDTVVLADLDPAYPGLETIAFGLSNTSTPDKLDPSYINAWHTDGTPVPGWPVKLYCTTSGRFNSPVAADIDGDGKLEVAMEVGSYDNVTKAYKGKLYVFKNSGVKIFESMDLDSDSNGCLAIGELDPAFPGLELAILTARGSIYIFHPDGSLMTKISGNHRDDYVKQSPVLADINLDGALEIITLPYIYKPNGTIVATLQLSDAGGDIWASPVVADLDPYSPGLEIVSVINGQLSAYRNNGIRLWSKQFEDSAHTSMFGNIVLSTPVIGDIDGDGDPEIIVGTFASGDIYAFHHTGELVDGWPRNSGGTIYSSFTLTDLTNDGTVDLIFTNLGAQQVWSLGKAPADYRADWPMFRYNTQNTGCVTNPKINYAPEDINRDGKINAIDVQLAINAILGKSISNYNADVDKDGKVTILDYERVKNVCLGIPPAPFNVANYTASLILTDTLLASTSNSASIDIYFETSSGTPSKDLSFELNLNANTTLRSVTPIGCNVITNGNRIILQGISQTNGKIATLNFNIANSSEGPFLVNLKNYTLCTSQSRINITKIVPGSINIYSIIKLASEATAKSALVNPQQAWFSQGTTLYSYTSPQWLEFTLNVPASTKIVGLLAKNIYGTLPTQYSFNIDVLVDGIYRGSFSVPGSTSFNRAGTIGLSIPPGIHKIRFIWKNDYYNSLAHYDANIQIDKIFIK